MTPEAWVGQKIGESVAGAADSFKSGIEDQKYEDLSPDEKIEHNACWKLIKELKGFMDNVEENFEDPDQYHDFLLDDKVIPFDILTTKDCDD